VPDSFNPDTRLLLGRKLSGRYVLTSLISVEEGTQKWLAKDLVLSRDVAVHLTNPFQITNSSQISSFRKEAKIVSRLNHPSIVTVLDTTGDDDLEAIVTELIEGETLLDHIETNGPLPLNVALPLLKEIANAVSFAHGKGIIHGNLSVVNIYLCPDRGPKVSGFGFNEFKQLIDTDLIPDHKNGGDLFSGFKANEGIVSIESDVFSLGKVMQYMLWGALDVPSKKQQTNAINKEILESIGKATAGEQSERYSSVVDFIDDLENQSTDTESDSDIIDPVHSSKSFDVNTFITKFLLTGFVFFFVLGIIFAANGNPFGSDNDSEPSEVVPAATAPTSASSVPSETETESESVETGTDSEPDANAVETEVSPIFEMVSVLGADDFDPLGDGVEHPELIDNLLDEDSETIWYSETYANRSMGGLKDGVGVIIELKKPYELQRVAIETTNTGWSGEVYVSDAPQSGLASWGTSVGSITASQGNATVDLTGVTGGAVLIWFTDLGDKPPPGIRMEISEIEVS
jgi:serine/threonine-protein kinase